MNSASTVAEESADHSGSDQRGLTVLVEGTVSGEESECGLKSGNRVIVDLAGEVLLLVAEMVGG